jgi:hypothetical protein
MLKRSLRRPRVPHCRSGGCGFESRRPRLCSVKSIRALSALRSAKLPKMKGCWPFKLPARVQDFNPPPHFPERRSWDVTHFLIGLPVRHAVRLVCSDCTLSPLRPPKAQGPPDQGPLVAACSRSSHSTKNTPARAINRRPESCRGRGSWRRANCRGSRTGRVSLHRSRFKFGRRNVRVKRRR